MIQQLRVLWTEEPRLCPGKPTTICNLLQTFPQKGQRMRQTELDVKQQRLNILTNLTTQIAMGIVNLRLRFSFKVTGSSFSQLLPEKRPIDYTQQVGPPQCYFSKSNYPLLLFDNNRQYPSVSANAITVNEVVIRLFQLQFNNLSESIERLWLKLSLLFSYNNA